MDFDYEAEAERQRQSWGRGRKWHVPTPWIILDFALLDPHSKAA